jgi:hypothetical protein
VDGATIAAVDDARFQKTVMAQIEGQDERAILRSVYSAVNQFRVGSVIRLDIFGCWPAYRIVEERDGNLILQAIDPNERLDPPT